MVPYHTALSADVTTELNYAMQNETRSVMTLHLVRAVCYALAEIRDELASARMKRAK